MVITLAFSTVYWIHHLNFSLFRLEKEGEALSLLHQQAFTQ